jgi:hypothetical protein
MIIVNYGKIMFVLYAKIELILILKEFANSLATFVILGILKLAYVLPVILVLYFLKEPVN